MSIPAFDPSEMEIADMRPGRFGGPATPVFHTPLPMKQAANDFYRGKPAWQLVGSAWETKMFCPGICPDNVARAFHIDGLTIPGVSNKTGGTDMFGIEWEYVPEVGGSMVRPGQPFIEDASEIPEKIVFPDLDTWDWETSAAGNREFLSEDRFIQCWLMNGWFERLISFMDFEGASIAMIDEDQSEYVKEFFDQLSDFYIDLLGRYLKYYPEIDSFYIHDDWGAQKDAFFSPDICEELIVPAMKKVTDWIHAQGRIAELHSCGQIFRQIPNIIKAGWDSWSQQVPFNVDEMYELYADKIILGMDPIIFDPETAGEEEQRASARDFVERFVGKDKPPVLLGQRSFRMMTPAFVEELYKDSRIALSE